MGHFAGKHVDVIGTAQHQISGFLTHGDPDDALALGELLREKLGGEIAFGLHGNTPSLHQIRV